MSVAYIDAKNRYFASEVPKDAKITTSQKRELFETIEQSGYNTVRIALLMKIHRLCKDDELCWMSHEKLAAQLGKTRRVLQAQLSELVADGVLICIRNTGYTNKYAINWQVLKERAQRHKNTLFEKAQAKLQKVAQAPFKMNGTPALFSANWIRQQQRR